MLKHDLIKHGPRQYECLACLQTWHGFARSICPGIKLHSRYNCGSLMTQKQLGYAGWRNADALLPLPAGCYRLDQKTFVMLYDPTDASKKRITRQHRTTGCVSEIFWPQAWIPLIETAVRLRKFDRQKSNSRFMRDLALLAFPLLFFTASEIEQDTGPTIHLIIPPVLIHTSYAAFIAHRPEQTALASNIVRAFESQRVVQ